MSDSPSWLATKAEGDRAELVIAGWFRERGFTAHKTVALADYDLLLTCSVEIKHDLRCKHTGNVAIEVAYKGRPSGIVTSTAAYWVIVTGSTALVAKTDKLRSFVLRGEFREVPAGDRKAAMVKLIPVELLRNAKGIWPVNL